MVRYPGGHEKVSGSWLPPECCETQVNIGRVAHARVSTQRRPFSAWQEGFGEGLLVRTAPEFKGITVSSRKI
jgi:hypothetical protein